MQSASHLRSFSGDEFRSAATLAKLGVDNRALSR
jgi:hypothetical protein